MTDIERLNNLFAREFGRNPHGEPKYKWVFLPTLMHKRYLGKDSWAENPAGIWVPEPKFKDVPAFPHLQDRWAICKWTYTDKDEWYRVYGNKTVWPPQGFYFPTDVICKPGVRPDKTWTEYWIGQIKLTMSKSAKEYEQKIESDMAREEEYTFRTIHDQILDACTAFGATPGSRSGGVSFPSVATH